jgi:hypothetical protein
MNLIFPDRRQSPGKWESVDQRSVFHICSRVLKAVNNCNETICIFTALSRQHIRFTEKSVVKVQSDSMRKTIAVSFAECQHVCRTTSLWQLSEDYAINCRNLVSSVPSTYTFTTAMKYVTYIEVLDLQFIDRRDWGDYYKHPLKALIVCRLDRYATSHVYCCRPVDMSILFAGPLGDVLQCESCKTDD